MKIANTLVDKIFSWVELMEECADKLDKKADEIEERNKKVNVAKVVGSSVSVAGAAAMTVAGVATFFTAGAALPVIALAGGAASWLGLANNAVSDVVNAVASGITLNEAGEVVKKIEVLHEEIEELVEKLKKEAQKKGEHSSSCSDDHETELILRALAKRVGLIVDDCVSLKKILEENFDQTVQTAICSVLKAIQITAVLIGLSVGGKLAAKATGRVCPEAGVMENLHQLIAAGRLKLRAESRIRFDFGRTAEDGGEKVVGGALGLAISIPELVANCKSLDISETEASKSLRENAKAIKAESEEMKKHLQQILHVFQRLVRVKCAIAKRGAERSSEDRKILIEFVTENLKDEVTLQWLRENPEPFFQLLDISDDLVKFLKTKLKEEEKKKHSNIVDITFVAHGAIEGSMMSASTLPQPRITDVLLYSPWNCTIDAKVAYSVATGRMKPQHREFYCGKEEGCKIPDAGHQPTKLPNEWNSMKKAGAQKIPNIMLTSLQPEDGALKKFMFFETQHGKAERNHIVMLFILPDEIIVPFSAVSLALSKALLDSRFEATLHLTACLSRYRNTKLDEDALKKQYACTIDNTAMTSSEDLSKQESEDLFRAFKAVFG